jgi:hypothetical protein
LKAKYTGVSEGRKTINMTDTYCLSGDPILGLGVIGVVQVFDIRLRDQLIGG